MISKEQISGDLCDSRLDVGIQSSGLCTDRSESLSEEAQDTRVGQAVCIPDQKMPVNQSVNRAAFDTVLPAANHERAKRPYAKAIAYIVAQQRLAEYGEELGYEVQMDQKVAGEFELAVVLHNVRLKIACYIPGLMHPAHDVRNMKECLKAGYSFLLVCCESPKDIRTLSTQLKKSVDSAYHGRLFFGGLEMILSQLGIITESEKPVTDQIIGTRRLRIFFSMTDEEVTAFQEVKQRSVLATIKRGMEA